MAIDAHVEVAPIQSAQQQSSQKLLDDVYSNPREFSQLLKTQFKQLDLDHDGVLTKAELDALASTERGTQIGAVAATALNHFDYLSHLSGNDSSPGISTNDVDAFQSKTDSAQCSMKEPSLGDTMVAGAAGGAVGGGLAAKAGGDKFGQGAGKGAAMGAAVGLVAYGVAESDYNSALQQRHDIDSWKEFSGTNCDGAKPTAKGAAAEQEVTSLPVDARGADHLDQNMGAVHHLVQDLDLSHHKTTDVLDANHIKSVENVFSIVDKNHDGYLSLDELASAAASPKLTSEQQHVAAILADNITIASELSGTNKLSGERISYADLEALPKLFAKPDKIDVFKRDAVVGAFGTASGAVGCVVGGIIGTAFASPEIGCPVGAVIAGGGLGYSFNKSHPKADTVGDELGREPVNQLRAQLLATE